MTVDLPPTGVLRVALTLDGSLALEVDPPFIDAAMAWLPRGIATRAPATAIRSDASTILVRAMSGAGDRPSFDRLPPILTLGSTTGFSEGRDQVRLRSASGGSEASILLATGRATVEIGDAEGAEHLEAMLTLCAALLLGRLDRALVHAAAVVDGQGGAWLLVGDSHSGKTTTCATLLDAGWRYCSDDQVVLGRSDDGGLEVEGWPRVFHLDAGFGGVAGPAGGVRPDFDPESRWPDRQVARSKLGGVLLPRVEPSSATGLESCSGVDRLQEVMRQSPWLFVDTAVAESTLALLCDVADLPGYRLRLGLDSFGQKKRLEEVLAPLSAAW